MQRYTTKKEQRETVLLRSVLGVAVLVEEVVKLGYNARLYSCTLLAFAGW